MFEHLERLRQKSDKEKKRFAFFIALSFTSFILLLWYFAVFPSFKEQSDIDKKIKKYESSPTSSLGSIFGSKVSEIKGQFSKVVDYSNQFLSKSSYYSSTSTEQISTSSIENAQ
jgi:predicted PurR-regulated permease PerM